MTAQENLCSGKGFEILQILMTEWWYFIFFMFHLFVFFLIFNLLIRSAKLRLKFCILANYIFRLKFSPWTFMNLKQMYWFDMGLEFAKVVDFCGTFPTGTTFNITKKVRHNYVCLNDSCNQVLEFWRGFSNLKLK